MTPHRPDATPDFSLVPENPEQNRRQSREWFYTHRGETYGPVSSTELRAAAHLGFIGPDDLVRCRDRNTWIAASNVEGLFKKFE